MTEQIDKKVCPYCGKELLQSESQVVCENCGSTYHQACWEQSGGCTQSFCESNREQQENPYPEYAPQAVQRGDAAAVPQRVQKKKRLWLRLLLGIGIPVLLLLGAGGILLLCLPETVSGTYTLLSGSVESVYTFEDGTYTLKESDDTKKGTYTVEGNIVTLTDEEGKQSKLLKEGDYLAHQESRYPQEVPQGTTFSQTFTQSRADTYLIYWNQVDFAQDGTYREISMIVLPSASSVTNTEQTGTYERTGDILVMRDEGKEGGRTKLIYQDRLYTVVYEKS